MAVWFGRNFNLENSFAALDPIAVFQVRGFDANTVYKSSVGRAQVAQETLWRRDLENAVMARKETVVRQAELSILAAPDHECVVLVECEVASGLRARNNMKCYTHSV